MFFSPFSIAITLLGEERANLSAFRTFVRFVLVWTVTGITEITTEITMEITKITIKGWGEVMLGVVGLVGV